jgi:hypothetical protein
LALKNFTLITCFFVTLPLFGQDSVSVSKNFRFADGVFLSFQEFRQNAPAYRPEDVRIDFFTNPQTSLTQIDSICLPGTNRYLDPDSVWAVCIDGIPYLRVPENEINRELPTFAALKLRGKICYFTYPDFRVKKIMVAAYNPLTGMPFRKGVVEREEEVVIEKMMHFESGEVLDFTVANFMRWIQDDLPLVKTIESLPPKEKQEKLFKCLLIYVDRNPVFVVNREE